MKHQDVKSVVGDLPNMSLKQATTITKFITDNQTKAILELDRYFIRL